MDTVISRPTEDGNIAYLAQIAIKCEGVDVISKEHPFDHRKACSRWIKKPAKEIKAAGAPAFDRAYDWKAA